ncbi:MAG: vanadium-dependent haloperoxidase [Chthonomonadales bacterium]
MSTRITRRAFLAASAAAPFVISGCGGGGGGGTRTRSFSHQWTQTILDSVSATKLGPPMTARAIGMVATAIFDAWAAYDPIAIGTRLGGQLRRPLAEQSITNKQIAISFAAYRTLLDLFPTEKPRFDTMMSTLGYNPLDISMDTTTPAGIGNKVAAELLFFRHTDGSNQLNGYADTTGYVPVNTPDSVVDPTKWQPLRFANGASPGYIAPHWGLVIPFALSTPSSLRPVPPPVYGTPTYLAQTEAVVDLTAHLDDTKKVIAEYWADGPKTVLPPGHCQIFGQFVSDRDNHTLDQDVKLFFMLGNAVMDAGIACWDAKRAYNTSRPFTAIRTIYAGKVIPSFGGPGVGIQMVDGSQWYPYQSRNFITPPFPEYVSGHSTFTAAGAEILKRFTSSDTCGFSASFPVGWSTFETGIPSAPVTLSWSTFSEAADQAGMSRQYGGIHFQAGDFEGRKLGRLVGTEVWNMAQGYIRGTNPARKA